MIFIALLLKAAGLSLEAAANSLIVTVVSSTTIKSQAVTRISYEVKTANRMIAIKEGKKLLSSY